MSPITIAIVSVVIFVILMITVKIVVGKVLLDKDRAPDTARKPAASNPTKSDTDISRHS